MKKFTLLFVAAFFMAAGANAQNALGNHVNANQLYDVVWDCGLGEFADVQTIQFDQTFTLAIDVTPQTALVDWLNTPDPDGFTRSVGLNFYVAADQTFNDAAFRLTKISGNIYGVTMNLKQLANTVNVTAATTTGAETYIYCGLFQYAYSSSNWGAIWWQGYIDIGGPAGAGSPIFRCDAYNGSHAGDPAISVSAGPFNNGLDLSYKNGWDYQCAGTVGVNDNIFPNAQEIDHIDYFNLQGIKLPCEPVNGLFIAVPYYKNGVRGTAVKMFNQN